LLNSPVRAAEVLLEADVPSMRIGLLDWRLSLGWPSLGRLRNLVHLALTRDAIWSVYHTEIRRWPLDAGVNVEPRVAPIREGMSRDGAEAEVIRQCHVSTEFAVQVAAAYHMLGAYASLLVLVVFAVMAAFRDRASGLERLEIGYVTMV